MDIGAMPLVVKSTFLSGRILRDVCRETVCTMDKLSIDLSYFSVQYTCRHFCRAFIPADFAES